MPAEVKLQAYQDQPFRGRLRQVFPSADRAKSIVEVRVSILDANALVKPEMTASVTFQERHDRDQPATGSRSGRDQVAIRSGSEGNQPPIVLVPKRAIAESAGRPHVWVVTAGTASRRPVTLGSERIDQVEVRTGVVPGEAVIVNPPPTLADRGLVRVKGT